MLFMIVSSDDVAMRSDNIRIFYQILQGVDFIHANGLIHRDLKVLNISNIQTVHISYK